MSAPKNKSRKRTVRFNQTHPKDPAIKSYGQWLGENQNFYADFRDWLKASGYGPSSIHLYGCAARQAIGYLDKPYWLIDPEADLVRVAAHLAGRDICPSTQASYQKGLDCFARYLRLRLHRPERQKALNWSYYLDTLPAWLQDDLRGYIHARSRRHKPDRQAALAISRLSPLTSALRWMAVHFPLNSPLDLTPQTWYAYMDERLAAGKSVVTINGDLNVLKSLLYYWQDQERPICERLLLVPYLDEGKNLPKDVPPEQLRQLLQAIHSEIASTHAANRRMGLMDLAWFLLMLHAGLRTCEVRALKLADIDWERIRLRIEQSKGLKDRLVYLSAEAVQALQGYLEVRGPKETLPEQVFIFRHCQLSASYCYERLWTYCDRLQAPRISPHQLRHSCATLLLNAGAPVISVQALLGHKWVDTTLGYARLYDGTVAADYYTAMSEIEQRLALPEDRLVQPTGVGHLLALVDALRQTGLNEQQIAALRRLREEMLILAEWQKSAEDVKVPV